MANHMDKKPFLTKGELFGMALMWLLAVIMGGYTIIPLSILAGALMSLGHNETDPGGRPNYGRALTLGLIAGLVVAVGCYLRNVPIAQLPKIERLPAGSLAVWLSPTSGLIL